MSIWLEVGAVGVIGAVWVLGLIRLLATDAGLQYLRSNEPAPAVRLNLERQADSLIVAGLVLAALALAPRQPDAVNALNLLGISFSAFVAAWVSGFLPARTAATVLSDGLVWLGVGSMLGGVYGISGLFDPVPLLAQVAAFLATLLTVVMSTKVVRSHVRAADKEHAARHAAKAVAAGPQAPADPAAGVAVPDRAAAE